MNRCFLSNALSSLCLLIFALCSVLCSSWLPLFPPPDIPQVSQGLEAMMTPRCSCWNYLNSIKPINSKSETSFFLIDENISYKFPSPSGLCPIKCGKWDLALFPNLQLCMTICRVHLSIALLFSKFHLHGSLIIKVINTMESSVHPTNFRERKQTVQSRSKENNYSHWSPFCFFFYSFSFLCLFMYFYIHPRPRFLTV